MITPLDVIVIHETEGRKYLEVLDMLARSNDINSVTFHGSSVLWRFAHILIREGKPLQDALGVALNNLRFLLRIGSVRGKTVVIGVAPWDFRLLYLMLRLRHNRLIYQTSWPWWDGHRVPRNYGVFMPLMRWAFRLALRRPGVVVVAVTQAAAESVAACIPGTAPCVIPHVITDAFFCHRARFMNPFRILFVGELSEKKGFREFLAVGEQLGNSVELEIVGDGPLRGLARSAALRSGCNWHGKVIDRNQLAEIASGCQLFLSLARKTSGWEELFGMAIIEAMAVGLPCIVSNHIGPRGIIRHGHDGFLVEEGNLDGVKSCIDRLMNDRIQWYSVATAAVETASQFSIPVVSCRWRKLLINSHPDVQGNSELVDDASVPQPILTQI
jgi:glycosyltransferase involved in cell wall biosynthesis